MIMLLLSSRGARLVDLPEPPPPYWCTVDAKPNRTSVVPVTFTRRSYTKVDERTYVEDEARSHAAA